MNKKTLILIALISIATMLFSCKSESKESVESTKNVESVTNAGGMAERTIMYYMIGSDLEENSLSATSVIADISNIDFPSNMNFIMMTGGSLNENVEQTRQDPEKAELYSKYYDINWETNQILKFSNGYEIIEKNFGNEDMTEEKTLEKFVLYVKKNYPAKKYDIIFSDHGGAGLYGFGTDTRYAENSGCLSLSDLVKAFKNSDIKFGTVSFDACLMASFELMCVLEPYSDYLIAAEETSFGDWNYSFLKKVAADVDMDSIDYGKAIVDGYMENTEATANSLGVFYLNGFNEAIDASLTKFSQSMNKYLVEDDYLQALYVILQNTIGLGYTSIGDTRDLRDFLYWLAYIDNYEVPKDLKDSAAELWESIEPFVVYYRTHKQKSEEGDERTGGINFVFPYNDVYYYEDDADSVLVSMKNYPDSLNEDYRLMYKLAFLRKALFKELKENTYEHDDKVMAEELNDICKRGLEKYKISKTYIDSIKENIVPNLSVNRLKSGDGGNIDFEKVKGKNNEISFNYKFNTDIAWMIYEPVATARTYGIDGKELKLGEVMIPRKETISGNMVTWSIRPEEDRWFTLKNGDDEKLVEFVVTEDNKKEDDPTNINYLFDKSVNGFIPAILRRYENDKDDENIIQIHVEFDGKNQEGKIIGFTRYDQNANMSAKEMESFKSIDKIAPIANFEDFGITKNISYLYANELETSNLKAFRGYTETQSVYFKYSVEDLYGEVYDCDVQNTFAFELNDGTGTCLYATFPSTWTDVVLNEKDSTFESISALGKHSEKVVVDMYEVTYDTINFGDMKEGTEFSDATIEYLLGNNVFSEIDDIGQDFLDNESSLLPLLYVVGEDKNNNLLSKKYVFFERDSRKYLIELDSIVNQEQNVYNSYHDMRLLRTALELVNSPAEKDEDIPTQKVEEKK